MVLRVDLKFIWEQIWYDIILCLELDFAMATAFWQTCFSKFLFFVFLLMKIYSNAALFIFLGLFAPFYSFQILFSKFWRFFTFGKILKSKVAAVWKSWRNCHVIWCHRHTWRTSQVYFWMYYIPLKYWHCLNILEVTERWRNQPPPPLSEKIQKSPIWIGLMTLM